MLLCTCKPWRVLLFVAVAGDTHAYSNFSQTKLYVSTAILLQSDVLCDGRHWNECLTRATWLQSWCCWLRRSPYQKVEFMVTIALLTFLTLHFFLCLIGPWDHFDKESEPVTSYIDCIDIEADRTWENGTCSSSRGGCGEPFWLLGLETPWFSWAATSDTEFFGNFAQLSDSRFLFIKDACWYSCPDCPTIHNYSYSKSSFNAQSLHSYRSALKGLWHGSRDLLQQCLLLWGGKVGWWHDRC